MRLPLRIEGVLFYKAEPVSRHDLARLLGETEEKIGEALASLSENLKERGIRLVESESEVELVSAPELSELIETLRRDELQRDIGKAGAETLSIILYKEPVTRTEIDYIRGVNSTFILRNLLVRGLIKRQTNPKDQRAFQYSITPALLKHLGVSRKKDLPEYETVLAELHRYEAEREEDATDE